MHDPSPLPLAVRRALRDFALVWICVGVALVVLLSVALGGEVGARPSAPTLAAVVALAFVLLTATATWRLARLRPPARPYVRGALLAASVLLLGCAASRGELAGFEPVPYPFPPARDLTDADLERWLWRCIHDDNVTYELFEPLLVEVASRGPRWIPKVEALLVAEKARVIPAIVSAIPPAVWYRRDVLVLTALRRLQGRPDPLTVHAELRSAGPFPLDGLPSLHVRLCVTPGESERFTILAGWSNDPWRPDRWDIELIDSQGRDAPRVDPWAKLAHGTTYEGLSGMFHPLEAGPGECWTERSEEVVEEPVSYELALALYREPRAPGDTHARVRYHPFESISAGGVPGERFEYWSQAIPIVLVEPRGLSEASPSAK